MDINLEWFSPTRSVHQGCNLAPFLFLVCSQVIADKINENKNISGIQVYDMVALLSQFADDTTLFLSFDKIMLKAVIDTLHVIENNTGLKVNSDKTCLYRIGSLANSDASIYTTANFAWTNEPVEILGITVSNNLQEMLFVSFNKIFAKVFSVMNLWTNRRLSIMGKMLVVNSLVGSLFVYKMEYILVNFVTQFYDMVHYFLWKDGKARIPKEVLCCDKNAGGLRLVELTCKHEAPKVRWIFYLRKNLFLAEVAFNNLIPDLGHFIFRCNLSHKHISYFIPRNNFWVYVFSAWCIYHYTLLLPKQMINQVLWLNCRILIDNKPIMWNSLMSLGINRVKDVMIDNHWPTHQEFCIKYSTCLSWLDFLSLSSA